MKDSPTARPRRTRLRRVVGWIGVALSILGLAGLWLTVVVALLNAKGRFSFPTFRLDSNGGSYTEVRHDPGPPGGVGVHFVTPDAYFDAVAWEITRYQGAWANYRVAFAIQSIAQLQRDHHVELRRQYFVGYVVILPIVAAAFLAVALLPLFAKPTREEAATLLRRLREGLTRRSPRRGFVVEPLDAEG